MTSEPEDEKAEAPVEQRVLGARARGEVSADAAFEELYREYRRIVAGWLAVRAETSAVDDLAQDVWLIFYARFRRWEFGAETESPEARPVLSFLFRTCQYVVRGYRRVAASRRRQSLDRAESEPSYNGRLRLHRELEATRALALAREICPEGELDVLLAKLAGMSAREIAETLSITGAMVDHRYRNALSRLRKEMNVGRKRGKERG